MIKIELNLEQAKMLEKWIGNMSFEDTERVCKEAKITSTEEIEEYDEVLDCVYEQLKNKLQLVKNKTKKNFKEVVSDAKYGEVWISKDSAFHNEVRIEKTSFGFKAYDENNKAIEWFSDEWEFELQRKEYSFEEAFKAYEEGKEIESVESKIRFLKTKPFYGDEIKDCIFSDSNWREVVNGNLFSVNEIRNKWYIND